MTTLLSATGGIAAPGPTMAPLPYTVTSVHRETYDTTTLVLQPESVALPTWAPGQFTMLYAFGVGEIPISVSGDPYRQDLLVHTVRDVGAVSRAIANARPGDVLGVRGPFGRGWIGRDWPQGDVVIVAGGLGLAPLRPIVYGLVRHRRRFGRITLVIGARNPAELLFTREYEAWRAGGLDVRVTVDRPEPNAGAAPWSGRVGLVTGPLAGTAIDPAWTTAYLCGPEVMMVAAAEALTARGVADKRVLLSLERSMKCGIGVCGHCQLGPDLICRDGPCVTYQHAAPLLAIKEL
ncbi:MAG TPA: FAD/NAD(P)-binding protein [Actinocrinis sp.]|nr:FAD/NAD(P)-binding protein [Actinocrinis sp.]